MSRESPPSSPIPLRDLGLGLHTSRLALTECVRTEDPA